MTVERRHTCPSRPAWAPAVVVDALADRFAAQGYRIRPLLLDIVMSPFFRQAGEPR